MCLLGATYLFEDNRRGWVKASPVFVVRGGRGVPCRGAGRCGHLMWTSLGRAPGPTGRGRHSPEGHSVARWGAALHRGT